jgi:drug/metabolite transporter (DMT)-like permease
MTPLMLRSMALVLTASVFGSFAAVFLKFGAAKIDGSLLSFANRSVIVGVSLYLASSVFYALGIKGGQLSVLYPMVSLGYIWTLLWARIFFNEPMTRQKITGLILILAGVAFVGMGTG